MGAEKSAASDLTAGPGSSQNPSLEIDDKGGKSGIVFV